MTTKKIYDKNVYSTQNTNSKGAALQSLFALQNKKRKKMITMIHQEMIDLAKALVEIPSINGTEGEKDIGQFLEEYLRNIPYFKMHPEQVIIQELKNDTLNRRNVFAILLGEKENKGDTLLLHGHTDTVGLEGYGAAKEYACKPDELEKVFREMNLPKEVREDLESGEYMFGRGACDMKSGDAVFLGILKELSEHPEELAGNIVVSFNPVEENLHTGIIEGLDVLEHLKEKYHLHYVMAINNDYICPLYPGDEVKTIYTGAVGKLLPCFYIQGKETHVGQCFEGLDASMLAAELVQRIHLNFDFSDGYEGEYSYPPSVLKIKDLKPWYNVQTAAEAFVYFNYFVHNSSMEEITNQLLKAAEDSFDAVFQRVNEQNKRFCSTTGQEYSIYNYDTMVCTYEELYKKAEKVADIDENMLQRMVEKQWKEGVDKREIPIAIIRFLLETAGITKPTIVLYYAAPYCPHNTLQGEEQKLIEDIEYLAKKTGEETGDTYRIMKFFPSLSDSSYLKIDDSKESIGLLVNNFPGFEQLYPVPIDKIQKLNIPAVNFGCYGKDAHKWTERVHIPYTFGHLPVLLRNTIDYYLKK